MSSKIILLCVVVVCSATSSFAQMYQTFPRYPISPYPKFPNYPPFSPYPKIPQYPNQQPNRNLPFNPNPFVPTMPYGPQPSYPNPQLPKFRFRRQILSGAASSNPDGGTDVKLNLGTGIGTPNHNLMGGVFAAGNSLGNTPVTTGAGLNYNLNGHGLSVLKTHTPGVADTFTQNSRLNILNSGAHKLDANAFKTDTKLANGFNFQKTGANLDYNHISGHGATLGLNNFKNIGTQTEALGRVNLWTSPDRNTKFDLNAGATRWNSGPFAGKNDFKGGFGLTTYFG